MEKLDLRTTRKALFTAPLNRFVLVRSTAAKYLMIDGHGDPNSAPAYRLAIESLYATAYALKATCKARGRDFSVAPLEGLWSADDPGSFVARRKRDWDWTMMIMVPDFVDDESVAAAGRTATARRQGLQCPKLEVLEEGLCLQALHVGSFDDEGPLLAMLHGQLMPAEGLEFAGRHHEVYLSDARRTPPARLRTILRQPVRNRVGCAG